MYIYICMYMQVEPMPLSKKLVEVVDTACAVYGDGGKQFHSIAPWLYVVLQHEKDVMQ